MSPVINVNSPGTRRNQARRTIAELLRQLMVKRQLDDEAKDMAAQIVFCLREIANTVDVSCEAWEKRNYFVKADRFRMQWEWAQSAAGNLVQVIVSGSWESLPQQLANLVPHFADIRVTKMTRSASDWKGRYQQLVQEGNREHVF